MARFLRPGGVQPLLSGKWYASGCFFPAKNDMFLKKVTCASKKKVLREGSPGPGTPLDRRGPRFRVRGCAGELEMLT